MDNKMLERWKLKTKGIFHKIVYDEFWLYINDLMKENERLKEKLEARRKICLEAIKREQDYKSRCEKAIEYLDNVETLAMLDGKIIFSINIFRNILQNGSDK